MIEWAMPFALGFCTAALLALLAIPAIWHRAARLARARKPNARNDRDARAEPETRPEADDSAPGGALDRERRENALLREKLDDLTARVIGLTARLDGDGEIAEMARSIAASGDNGEMSSLAERIKALRNQTS